MDDPTAKLPATSPKQRYHNKLQLLIGGVIMVSLMLVSVAIGVYNSGGAAQLDMSVPGLSGARSHVQEDKNAKSFPASGSFDKQAFEDFDTMYKQRTSAVQAINGFDPAAVNNDSINILSSGQTQ